MATALRAKFAHTSLHIIEKPNQTNETIINSLEDALPFLKANQFELATSLASTETIVTTLLRIAQLSQMDSPLVTNAIRSVAFVMQGTEI